MQDASKNQIVEYNPGYGHLSCVCVMPFLAQFMQGNGKREEAHCRDVQNPEVPQCFWDQDSTGDTDDRHWYPHAEKVQPKSAMRTMQFVLFDDSKTCP